MSETTKRQTIHTMTAITGSVLAFLAMWQGYAVLPWRMEAVEKKVQVMEQEAKGNRELLIRIEEHVKRLREDIRR